MANKKSFLGIGLVTLLTACGGAAEAAKDIMIDFNMLKGCAIDSLALFEEEVSNGLTFSDEYFEYYEYYNGDNLDYTTETKGNCEVDFKNIQIHISVIENTTYYSYEPKEETKQKNIYECFYEVDKELGLMAYYYDSYNGVVYKSKQTVVSLSNAIEAVVMNGNTTLDDFFRFTMIETALDDWTYFEYIFFGESQYIVGSNDEYEYLESDVISKEDFSYNTEKKSFHVDAAGTFDYDNGSSVTNSSVTVLQTSVEGMCKEYATSYSYKVSNSSDGSVQYMQNGAVSLQNTRGPVLIDFNKAPYNE